MSHPEFRHRFLSFFLFRYTLHGKQAMSVDERCHQNFFTAQNVLVNCLKTT